MSSIGASSPSAPASATRASPTGHDGFAARRERALAQGQPHGRMSTVRIHRHRQHRRFVVIKAGVAGALLGLAIGAAFLLRSHLSSGELPMSEALFLVLTTVGSAVLVAVATWIVVALLQSAWRGVRPHETDRKP